MSAGAFDNAFYELSSENGGGIAACRVQPETLACEINSVANASATGPADIPISARMIGPRRAAGINSRYVTLEWTGSPPTGYSGDNVRIPVLTPATYAAWTLNATGTYLGAAVRVAGRNPERVR